MAPKLAPAEDGERAEAEWAKKTGCPGTAGREWTPLKNTEASGRAEEARAEELTTVRRLPSCISFAARSERSAIM